MSLSSVKTGTGSAPWQLQWKRPVWQQHAPNPLIERRKNESRVPVGHCAAAILVSEYQGLDTASEIAESDGALVLTVTLLQSQDETSAFADVVELQVFRSAHSTPGSGSENSTSCLLSRTLQWPSSPDRRAVRNLDRSNTPTCQFPLLALFTGSFLRSNAGSIQDMHDNETEQRQRRHTLSSGLVAAALVRVPCWNRDEKGDTPSQMDARDMLQFLSLETPSEHAPTDQRKLILDQSPDDATKVPTSTNATENVSALLLACLTNHGKVHFYSPWSLLERATVQNDAVDGMASFLFGESLLTTVQQTQLPLSQPSHTVSLSVPFLQQPTRNESHEELGRSRQSQQPMPFLSMFDASMWDPILDRATLWYQTKDNIPTLCVFAFEYLCVAGCGRQRWDRISTVPEATIPNVSGTHDGGFVTFISLHNFAEKHTVFVPFVPVHVSPFHWGDMLFVLVASLDRAVAIRVDALARVCHTALSTIPVTSESLEGSASNQAEHNAIDVRRFQLIPIDLPSNNATSRIHCIVGCDVLVSPPAVACLVRDAARGGYTIVEQTFRSIDNAADHVPIEYTPEGQATAVIATARTPGHAMRTSFTDGDIEGVWFRLGQGWCIVGSPKQAQFVCFEGSNNERVAAVTDLASFDKLVRCMASSILPIDPFRIPSPQNDSNTGGIFSARQADVHKVLRGLDTSFGGDEDLLDDFILGAMESISRLSFRDNGINQLTISPRKKASPYTLQEKADILLEQCASWACLERSYRLRSSSLVPVTSLRTTSNDHLHLSLRDSAVTSGPASSFQDVLTWLSDEQDYFTASSVALNLLRDDESLRHLWRSFDKIDRDDECSKLDGLLDGIVPIHPDNHDGTDPALSATLARLADLTVCCLVKGGYAMSSTLDQFLSRSTRYDPSGVGLMLVATTACVLSGDINTKSPSEKTEDGDSSDRVLWPVKCLLKVGVARGRLSPALVMLNTTIPDQLRSRDGSATGSASLSALDLCKALVSMVVSSSPEATELLLDLIDEKTRMRFWDSLEHEVRLDVSFISIDNKYPLVQDLEVRSWALGELQKCVVNEVSASTANIYGVTPSQWLCALVHACLKNAGSDLETMLHPKPDESKDDFVDNSGLVQYREDIQSMRKALAPSAGTGGLDFGVLIPALLVLEHRDVLWHVEAETTTRSVLNAVCWLAGRRNQDEPLFPLNSATIMKQCTLLGDVEAGANFIGGRNGLILECCRVLIDEIGLTMDEAEELLLSDDVALREVAASKNGSVFDIQSCHRTILWLLEEHVLRIRTYGEFAESRGRVDPVQAATLCFRTWLAVTQHELLPATRWLTQWLRNRLSLINHQSVSPNRLVYAALVRALIWPETKAESTSLANLLQLDGVFLVQLSRACCGLVEAVPAYISNGNLRLSLTETPSKVSIFPPPFTPAESTATGRSEAIDESFVSAVTSFRDLNTSNGSW